ncbi:DUF1643 domain-containing protein [Lacticaseibacillus saniviri]|nr:DUF1643 domain-containing protein [Lacticaseibacillus saniviri]
MVREKTLALETIKVTSRHNSENLYWVRWVWDESKPQYMVICNYPSDGDPRVMDITRLLIMNHIRSLTGGGVVVANLFSKPKSLGNSSSLTKAGTDQGLLELVSMAHNVDEVILGMGSLPSKSKVAQARLAKLMSMYQEDKVADKLKMLVNPDTGKPSHPLSLQGSSWKLVPVQVETKD